MELLLREKRWPHWKRWTGQVGKLWSVEKIYQSYTKVIHLSADFRKLAVSVFLRFFWSYFPTPSNCIFLCSFEYRYSKLAPRMSYWEFLFMVSLFKKWRVSVHMPSKKDAKPFYWHEFGHQILNFRFRGLNFSLLGLELISTILCLTIKKSWERLLELWSTFPTYAFFSVRNCCETVATKWVVPPMIPHLSPPPFLPSYRSVPILHNLLLSKRRKNKLLPSTFWTSAVPTNIYGLLVLRWVGRIYAI